MNPSCVIRQKLSQLLTDAIQEVNRLREEPKSQEPGSDEQTAILHLLQKAREKQREAEHAFLDHIKEHRCAVD